MGAVGCRYDRRSFAATPSARLRSGFAFLPRQLPPLPFQIQLRKRHRLPESLELRELPQLRVLPESVVHVHADRDQAARAVEEAEVEDEVAHELGRRVAD